MSDNLEKAIDKVKNYLKNNQVLDKDILNEIAEETNLNFVDLNKLIIQFPITLESQKTKKINETLDLSRTDYDEIFYEVLSLEPSLESFINRVKEITPPQRHETTDLFKRLDQGDTSVINRLVQMHIRPMIKQALDYSKKYKFDLEDSIMEGIISIYYAIQKFLDRDQNNGYFLSYLSLTFQTRIYTYGKSIYVDVYYPVHIREKIYQAIRFYFSQNLIEDDLKYDIDYWAKELSNLSRNLDFQESKEYLILINKKINQPRYYTDLDNEEFLYSIEDSNKLDFINDLIDKELEDLINIENLSDREKVVIKLRFGLKGHEPHTLEEVGSVLHVTRERVRQIQNRALNKLKVDLQKLHLNSLDQII